MSSSCLPPDTSFFLSVPEEPVLFRWFPKLRDKLAWVPLTQGPTPLHPLPQLAEEIGRDNLWVKRDDLCGRWYGGNKPRKLEFILGDAIAKRAKTVVTIGALGSNHTLATTICARERGLRSSLLLVERPLDAKGARNLRGSRHLGASLTYAGGDLQAGIVGFGMVMSLLWKDKAWPYIIPPGGSSPLGCLGYVNAALELAEQIRAGEAPEFEEIYIPVGSMGTYAGLLLGLRLAGISSRVCGVKVSDDVFTSARGAAWLIRRCLRILRRIEPSIPDWKVTPQELWLDAGFLGQGYAYPTEEGRSAITQMRECEGLELELVYSGKTLASLLHASKKTNSDTSTLFWNTYNSLDWSGLFSEDSEPLQLPMAFHKRLKEIEP